MDKKSKIEGDTKLLDLHTNVIKILDATPNLMSSEFTDWLKKLADVYSKIKDIDTKVGG